MKIKIHDGISKRFKVTEKDVQDFANCSKDRNPIHLDKEYAESSIFKRRIAHGMLLGSYISSVLGNDFPGIVTIYVSQSLNFKQPVFFDDIITVNIEVKGITERDWLELSTICLNQDKDLVIEGTAVVIPPRNSQLIRV